MNRWKLYRWLMGGCWALWHRRWLQADKETGLISYTDPGGQRRSTHFRSNEIERLEDYDRPW
jgi:hypothetical protein